VERFVLGEFEWMMPVNASAFAAAGRGAPPDGGAPEADPEGMAACGLPRRALRECCVRSGCMWSRPRPPLKPRASGVEDKDSAK